jgi:hypothetical protein
MVGRVQYNPLDGAGALRPPRHRAFRAGVPGPAHSLTMKRTSPVGQPTFGAARSLASRNAGALAPIAISCRRVFATALKRSWDTSRKLPADFALSVAVGRGVDPVVVPIVQRRGQPARMPEPPKFRQGEQGGQQRFPTNALSCPCGRDPSMRGVPWISSLVALSGFDRAVGAVCRKFAAYHAPCDARSRRLTIGRLP